MFWRLSNFRILGCLSNFYRYALITYTSSWHLSSGLKVFIFRKKLCYTPKHYASIQPWNALENTPESFPKTNNASFQPWKSPWKNFFCGVFNLEKNLWIPSKHHWKTLENYPIFQESDPWIFQGWMECLKKWCTRVIVSW